MKKVIMLTLLIAFVTATFCQQTVQTQSAIPTDYLNKSIQQKATGWVLLVSGTVVLAFTAATSSHFKLFSKTSFPIVPVSLGGSMMVASIPFFIVAGSNKRKAATLLASLKIERRLFLREQTITNSRYPAISVKINISNKR